MDPTSMELSQLRLRKPAVAGGSWSGCPQFIPRPLPAGIPQKIRRAPRPKQTQPRNRPNSEPTGKRGEGKSAARARVRAVRCSDGRRVTQARRVGAERRAREASSLSSSHQIPLRASRVVLRLGKGRSFWCA